MLQGDGRFWRNQSGLVVDMQLRFESVLGLLTIVSSTGFLLYLIWLFIQARGMRPRIDPAEITFEERFASGSSQKNILTRLGGGRNCVRLVVTRSILWVTSWLPFSLFAPFYDMEHVIPLDAIESIRQSRSFGRVTLLLCYRDSEGHEHVLKLSPQQPDAFIESLGVRLEE